MVVESEEVKPEVVVVATVMSVVVEVVAVGVDVIAVVVIVVPGLLGVVLSASISSMPLS